jgi:redox-regulated HSP33 family molecular chaperone
MTEKDTLIRFLLPEARARGAIIRGKHIVAEANAIHGLQGEPALLFGQTLLASIMLLSISKGGVRQVLQLDASDENTPIKRMQAESKSGAVRGYVQWREGTHSTFEGEGIVALMGENILLSTVRDLGVGQPYVSTVQHDSAWLADHMLEYLRQSVQVQADMLLVGDLAMMIEAMPGCDDAHWFKAVEAMAKINNSALAQDEPEEILNIFADLGCQIVGKDAYVYQCSCSKETMMQALIGIAEEDLAELADEAGDVTLSCQYCNNHVKVNIGTDEEKCD